MRSSKFSFPRFYLPVFILLLVLISIACGAGTSLEPASGQSPSPTQSEISPEPTLLIPVTGGGDEPTPAAPAPSILETRRLTLEFPSKMRAGVEGDVVRLTLEVDDLGNITPTAQIEGNVVTGETIQIPDMYDTHNVTAEARLDLAGMDVTPPESIFEPLKRGQSATFYWSIRPQETGVYRGTVWLHLNFEDRSTGESSRIAVSAQIIEIEAVDFFGLSVNVARTSGVVGSIVGGVVGFPFLEDILKFVFKRKRQERKL